MLASPGASVHEVLDSTDFRDLAETDGRRINRGVGLSGSETRNLFTMRHQS